VGGGRKRGAGGGG